MRVEFLGTGGADTTPNGTPRLGDERGSPGLAASQPDLARLPSRTGRRGFPRLSWKLERFRFRGVDLAVVPLGLIEFDPFTGERRIPHEHPVLKSEATFDQTLTILGRLAPRRVAFTHFEESDGLGFDDHRRVERRLREQGMDVVFAYDTLVLDLP